MKTGILFDLDGTLLDTLQDLTDAVNYTLDYYHCPRRTAQEVRSFVGNGIGKLMELALPGLDTDPDLDTVVATYRAYYIQHDKDKTCPYPGILDALAEIRKDFPVAGKDFEQAGVAFTQKAPTGGAPFTTTPGVKTAGEREPRSRG